ncbi:MAG TPA: NADH-quinone oxidoreductase subunit M, partial [Tepidisphaeraceae bacterium]|nr:NADH-quinone oxidoreductase subunit M [Tepidisphaeraceae bacterium]
MMNLLAQIESNASNVTSGGQLGIMLALPLIGAIFIAIINRNDSARLVGLLVTGINVVLSFILVGAMNGSAGTQLRFSPGDLFSITGPPAFSFTLGLDQISIWLVLLTTIISMVALFGSYGVIKDRFTPYAAWMLVLESALIGAFTAQDSLLFYGFFELTLVPCFFLINGWGGTERKRAAARFFLFTFAGSVFMLASILYVGISAGTFEMGAWTKHLQNLPVEISRWVIIGLLVGLLVKVPLIPFHSWLPLAYTQAPAPVTALLSGVLAKLGTYGLLRLVMPGLVDLTHPNITYVIALLAVIGVLAMALVAWLQNDAKTLVAYSSISHLGFCVLAL